MKRNERPASVKAGQQPQASIRVPENRVTGSLNRRLLGTAPREPQVGFLRRKD